MFIEKDAPIPSNLVGVICSGLIEKVSGSKIILNAQTAKY